MEKYVLVTGGDRGIGRAIVLKFAEEGYTIAFTYLRKEDKAKETAEKASSLGAEAFYLQMDVSNENSVVRGYSIVSKLFPKLDVLVNNAGIILFKAFEEISAEEWRKVMDVNVFGPFMVTKTFLPLLKKAGKATIINVASIAGETGNVVASVAYSASKSAVIGLTKRLAVELAPNIRVNAVSPSFVDTEMVHSFIDTPEKREQVKSLHPLNDIATPEDVANAVFFLASEKARYITGHVLRINGGRLT